MIQINEKRGVYAHPFFYVFQGYLYFTISANAHASFLEEYSGNNYKRDLVKARSERYRFLALSTSERNNILHACL